MPKEINLQDPTSTTGDVIKKAKLQQYVTRYTKERYKHLKKNIENDSRSVHLSKTIMNAFWEKNKEADGVRMYFGVIKEPKQGFPHGVHNLIFVPTKSYKDLLGENDWVIVTKNMDGSGIVTNACSICPPGPPCTGEELETT